MRQLILILALALLVSGAGAIKWSGIELREDANLSMDDGFVNSTGGIIFNGTAPTTTEGVLYSDGGNLRWGGLPIGNSNLPYDVMIVEATGGEIYAYNRTGHVVASDVSAPFEFGAVFDAVTALVGENQTIVLDGSFSSTTTASLVNGTKLYGMAESSISTASVIAVFDTADDDYLKKDILIENLRIYYTGTATPAQPLIVVYDAQGCTFRNVNAVCTAVSAYNVGYKGSLSLVSDINYTWLNKIEDCTLNQIRLDNITDSVIENCAINNYGKGPQAIKLSGLCNNVKIVQNEIVCDTYYGISVAGACYDLQITENYFEAHMHAPTVGNLETAISMTASTRYCTIENNHFSYLNGNGIVFNGKYGIISNNVFQNMNTADSSYSDIDLTGDTNMVIGNLGTNIVGSSNKALMIADSDYNMVYNNHAKGDGYTGVFTSGGHSLADNNVAWSGTP